jgi:predicted Rossmann-fold nucleotide-binding protein
MIPVGEPGTLRQGAPQHHAHGAPAVQVAASSANCGAYMVGGGGGGGVMKVRKKDTNKETNNEREEWHVRYV